MIDIKTWWQWFNPKEDVYEFRIRNFPLIKYIATKLNIPYSASGIYFSTLDEYQKIIPYVKNKETCWISVNAKKKSINKWGKLGYNGKDTSIESINNIFIDIDPVDNKGDRIENLKNIYKFVNEILKDLEKQNIKDYAVICSGYGFQILIKLDIPMMLPEQTWDKENKIYILDNKFSNYKILIKKTFMAKLVKKFGEQAKDFCCLLDKSASNLGRVHAAPFTSNVKYGKSVPRMVVKISKDVSNDGLSDWLLGELENIKTAPVYNSKRSAKLDKHFKLNEKTLINNELVQWILFNDLPSGMRNNTLLFSLKCLIKDNNIDFRSEVVKHLKMRLDQKWQRDNPFNIPDDKYHFSPNTVNNFCIHNRLPLLYKSYYNYKATKPRDVGEHVFTFENYKAYPNDDITKLSDDDITKLSDEDLTKTILDIKKQVDNVDEGFVKKLYSCLKFVEKEYDLLTVKYVLEEVAPYYFNTINL